MPAGFKYAYCLTCSHNATIGGVCVRAKACVRLDVGFSQWDSYYLQAGSAKDLRMVAP